MQARRYARDPTHPEITVLDSAVRKARALMPCQRETDGAQNSQRDSGWFPKPLRLAISQR